MNYMNFIMKKAEFSYFYIKLNPLLSISNENPITELEKTFRGCNFLPGPIPQCLKLIIIILQIQIRFAKFSLNVNIMS